MFLLFYLVNIQNDISESLFRSLMYPISVTSLIGDRYAFNHSFQ